MWNPRFNVPVVDKVLTYSKNVFKAGLPGPDFLTFKGFFKVVILLFSIISASFIGFIGYTLGRIVVKELNLNDNEFLTYVVVIGACVEVLFVAYCIVDRIYRFYQIHILLKKDYIDEILELRERMDRIEGKG